jgi:hypothetical protein
VDADTTLIDPALTEDTNFIWRCRDVSEEGIDSDWMTTQAFLTKDYSVNTPTVTVEGSPSSVNQSPLITLSAYTTSPDQTATYASTDWEVRRVSDDVLVFSSYGDTVNVSSILVPPGSLATSTAYYFRGRYNSTIYGSSAYGSTSATTLATFTQQLFTALPFVNNQPTSNPAAYPQKKIFAIDDTRSIQCYQRSNRDSALGTTGTRWYLAVVTNTVNGPVTNSANHLILPSTVAASLAPQIVMRSTTVGYMVWGSADQLSVIFADISISGDVITLGTQTVIGTSTTAGNPLQPTITTIRDGWYMVAHIFRISTSIFTRVFGVEVVDGLPVVGTAVDETSYTSYDTASIGGDRVVAVISGVTTPFIYAFTKPPFSTLTVTKTLGTVFPTATITSFTGNFAVAALANNTVMVVGFATTSARTVAVVISDLQGATNTQTYSPVYAFNTILATAVGDVTALNSSTVLYTRLDSVSALSYNAAIGNIVETGRVIPSAAAEMVSIRALQAPHIASPNATAAHLYAGWASGTDAFTTTSVTLSNGVPVLSPVAYVLGFALNPTTSANAQSITTLSTTRAVVMTREFDETSTVFVSTVLRLFDTSGQTPILLSLLNISGGISITNSTPFVVTALSETKILIMSGGTVTDTGILSLVTVSGNTMTLNQSVAYPALYRNSADIAALTTTSALLVYITANTTTPKAQLITLDGAGTSMVIGAETAVSTNTTSYCRVAALSATRAIITYATFASLVDVSGGTIVVLQQNLTTIATVPTSARIVPLSATTALYCRNTTTSTSLALITMSGDTISAGSTSSTVSVVSEAEMSIAPTTSTSGVLLSSQTANLSIYTFSISGTTVTTALVNSTITTAGTSTSGAGIISSLAPYAGTPPSNGYSLLVYRDSLAAAGSTGAYKIQKYLRA